MQGRTAINVHHGVVEMKLVIGWVVNTTSVDHRSHFVKLISEIRLVESA
jgi:hypothetical protein